MGIRGYETIATGVVLLVGAAIGWADEPATAGPPVDAPSSDGARSATEPARNPFSDKELVDRQTERQPPSGPPGRAAVKLPDGVSAPVLLGYVEDTHGVAAALIDIPGSGVQVAREGDTLSAATAGRYVSFRVLELRNRAVTLQLGTQGPVMVLR